MQYVSLGNTGLKVSRLCFGGLIIGPLQANLPVGQGADVIVEALRLGVNFIDTAELYGTYPHIREAIKRFSEKPIIATKSYAYTAEGARESLEKARKEMDIDIIDVFLLHEQESRLTLKGHREALEYYINAKQKGLIKAVGVSTHNIEVVEACAEMPEIDVIHPLINKQGIGIGDGKIDGMLKAVQLAYNNGKGIYGMKPLGGGNLLGSFDESIKFVLDLPYLHSIAVGMQSVEEVIMNVSIFNGCEVPEEIRSVLSRKRRKLHIDYWCEGCGNCVERCRQKALTLVDNKAVVAPEKCVLCGYCGSVCPQFAIKIF
jgi:aryl-alcohol dehydrogenase-like predicted oxidoreductase